MAHIEKCADLMAGTLDFLPKAVVTVKNKDRR